MFTETLSILFIDDNSEFILPLLRSFADYPDIKLHVLLSDNQKPKYYRYSKYLRSLYWEESLNEKNFEKIVKEAVCKSSADLVISTREWISIFISLHKQELEKIVKIQPVSDVNTLETVSDKWKLNCWLEKNNFPFSNSLQLSNKEEMDIKLNTLSFPVLLKPLEGLGGIGIRLLSSKEDLISTLSGNEDYTKSYFIQEYIEGYTIDISFFAISGKILFHTIQKGIIPTEFSYSKGIEFVMNQELFDITSQIVSKLNYSGVANLDFRVNVKNGTFVLIDFNARYWSSVEGSRVVGVNFPLLIAAYSMGIQFNYPTYSTGTYYFAIAAIKTLVTNLFSKTKYPIKLSNTGLRSILKDPVPEIVYTGQKLLVFFLKLFRKSKSSGIRNK